jgi:hypothetical protein
MTSHEPRDEPSLRPPQDAAAAPAPAEPPRDDPPQRVPVGEPADPFDAGATQSDPTQPPPGPDELPPDPDEPPDPYAPPPYPEPPGRGKVRTEQMQRNADYVEAQKAEEAPKPGPKDTGKYPGKVPPLSMPPDPLRPYSSGFSPRKRRPEWPVLIFALVVVAVVIVGCCLSGFALFSVWHPLNR